MTLEKFGKRTSEQMEKLFSTKKIPDSGIRSQTKRAISSHKIERPDKVAESYKGESETKSPPAVLKKPNNTPSKNL